MRCGASFFSTKLKLLTEYANRTSMPISGCVYVIHPIVVDTHFKMYVGSTDEGVDVRRRTHKYSCNTPNTKRYNYPVYQYIRANGGWNAFKMSVIEQREYEDDDELRFCEQFHLNRVPTEMKLNNKNAYNTAEDYRAYLRTLRAKYRDEYNKKERERVALKMQNQDYRELHNKKQRDYLEKNRELHNKKRRERYAKKKELLTEQT